MTALARRDTFTLVHGDTTVRLRASLRAALTLERLHDGFAPLFAKIAAFDTATIRTVILTAAIDQDAAQRLLDRSAGQPLAPLHRAAQGALVGLCGAFLPEDKPSDQKPSGKPQAWADAFADLYRIGTGWLGWTPAATWQATPTEIVEALDGLLAKLKAMHGGANDEPGHVDEDQRAANVEAGLDPDFDRAGLQRLKALSRA